MAKNFSRKTSRKMRRFETGKFVRVLSYKNCGNNLESAKGEKTEVHSSRFWMLLLFCLGSMMSGLSYTTYTIIGDVVGNYFYVPYSLIEWTSMVYMLGYIIPLLPVIWLVEEKGLRAGFLVGMIGTAIGYWITCCYINDEHFGVIILGQTVIGAFQACFMPLTPQFASVWFGSKEISKACSIGIFFNTLGNSLSCIIPPLIVKSTGREAIRDELLFMGFGYAIVATVLAIIALIFFKEQPPLPPTLVQAVVRKSKKESTTSTSLNIARDVKKLLTNKNFVLHMISYGFGFSIADVVAAILNHMVLSTYPDAKQAVGILGLLIHLPGVPASLLFGIIMDKTHKYKETAIAVYTAALISYALFIGGFHFHIYSLYGASALLGFFGAGYLPIGLELGAEITYPIPEVTSSGLLIMAGAMFTLILTYATDHVLTVYGVLEAQLIMLAAIVIGLLSAIFVKADLNRLNTCEEIENTEENENRTP